MAKRKAWKTKTFWTGIGMIGFGVALCVQKQWQAGTQAILGGLGLMFLRSAVEKNQLED